MLRGWRQAAPGRPVVRDWDTHSQTVGRSGFTALVGRGTLQDMRLSEGRPAGEWNDQGRIVVLTSEPLLRQAPESRPADELAGVLQGRPEGVSSSVLPASGPVPPIPGALDLPPVPLPLPHLP